MKTKITQVQQKFFVRSAIAAAITSAFAPGVALAQEAAATTEATELEKVEVTGSRLGRADIEGALPVAVITREDIDRSGFTSVGELLRNTTFNSLGAFRAQSGSSAQSLVAVDLRGLGSERTLVLIDGRRAPKAPYAPTTQDLNAVPIAIVERIEVLKDGASAIYGSDAIAGVINIITRKNYSGAQVTYQQQGAERDGGDSKGGQFVAGTTTENANLVFGASYFTRDIIFARDSLFNTPGASFFSNNYILSGFTDGDGDFFDDNTGVYYYGAVPGGCPNEDPNFFLTGGGTCGYNFNRVAADEAATANQGVFARADVKVADDWRMTVTGSVSRATSFGRYAPSLNDTALFVSADNPNNTVGQDFFLYHRFAALGTRDNDTDAHVYDLTGVMTGTVGDLNINTGIRHNEYQYYELGRNYVVLPIAQAFIDSGDYNFLAPTTGDPDVLKKMKATITRDSIWRTLEYFAEANMPVFDMTGGSAAVAAGLEYRSERYFDAYDSLQEGGAIGGSAGNSAGSDRQINAAYFELFLPVLDTLEVSFSGRYEDYNDVGSSAVPKLSARYQPTDRVTLRASVGQGFRAPTLDIISALPTFSAESINNDGPTCTAAGAVFDAGTGTCSAQQQVNTTIISNPALVAEESDQFSFGVAFDVTDSIDVSIDYYSIALTDRLNFISPSVIIDRIGSGDPIPAGLGVTRSIVPAPGFTVGRITQVIAGYANEGDLDTSGFDLEANAEFDLGPAGRLKSGFLATYILEYKIDSGRDLVGDPAVPEYRATLGNTWTPPLVQGVTVAFNGNHIADQAQRVSAGGVKAGHIPSYTTWDLQVAYDLPFVKGSNVAVGALNVFNKDPSPKSAFDGRDYNFYLYDQYGTQPYFKYTHTF